MKHELPARRSYEAHRRIVGLAGLLMLVMMASGEASAAQVQVNTGNAGTASAPDASGTWSDSAGAYDPDVYPDDPWSKIDRIHQRMMRIFQGGFAGPQMGLAGSIASAEPQMEVENHPEAYTLKADLPGMDKDKLDVKAADGQLIISGERVSGGDGQSNDVVWSERRYGAFSRTLPLPENVKIDKMKARYENGVLTVTLPKVKPDSPEQGKTVNIPVE